LQDQLSQIMEVVMRIDGACAGREGNAQLEIAELRRALYAAETERDNFKRYLGTKEDAIIILTRQLQSVTAELNATKESLATLRTRLAVHEGAASRSGSLGLTATGDTLTKSEAAVALYNSPRRPF
jgi:septal ring factor EnvC (AmiA/AmiB activator)